MKYNLILATLLISLLPSAFLFSKNDKQMEKIQKISEEVKNKYAPDKRNAVFNIEAAESEGLFALTGETNSPAAKQELLKNLKEANVKVKDEIKLLPSAELKGKEFGVINMSVANIRTKPDQPEEMANQALLGMPVKVLKKSPADSWYLIQTSDEYISWAEDDAVKLMDKDEMNAWNKAEKVIYTKDYGFSFSEAALASRHVSDLVKGDVLKFISSENGFVKTGYPDGRIAFIPQSECEDFTKWLESRNPSEENLLSAAFTYMGVPYLWGGTSPKGMDCSGFTKTIYFQNGIILPRDASQQVFAGEEVIPGENFQNLKPGDLLFFGRKAKGDKKEKATHVAMYIGGSEYIHEAGMAKINSLDRSKPNFSEYRYNSFLHARRMITSIGKNGVIKIQDCKFYREQ